MMANDALNTYLNDHLAGAGAAIDFLSHLIETSNPPAEPEFLKWLRGEFEEDRAVLEDVIRRVGGRPSGLRQLGGWIAEKAGRLKLVLDDPAGLKPLESLEVVVIGIHGKRSLWRALAAVAPTIPELNDVDFVRMESRAEDQQSRVEVRRIENARAYLVDPPA
jgi:hypothetical protein